MDLADMVVGQVTKPQPRSNRIRSLVQVAAVAAVVAVVVVGVDILTSSDHPPTTPVATPTPANTAAAVTDTGRALLGTWQVATWNGEPLPKSKEMLTGPLVTFDTDGTWYGSDGCNDLAGNYRVGPGALFEATTKGTTLVLCGGVDPLPVPARGAVRVTVQDDLAIFFDTEGQQVVTYRRPGGPYAAEARLVTRSGDPALALSTYSSGSCPTRIGSISLEADNQLTVALADPPPLVCPTDLKWSTDVMAIPGGLNLDAPITAMLMGAKPPFITLLVDTSAILGEPLLVKAQDWDGSPVDQARLEGILGVNEQGCVTVGGTVVMWPNTYALVTDRANTWAIAAGEGYGPGYLNIIGTEGQQVTLAGGMTVLDVNPGPLPLATYPECLLGDYWTGIIDVQANN